MRDNKPDLLGQSIGHIKIVDVLSQGGMGTVYVGEDETLQRKVAVKAIHGAYRMHKVAKARFLREARILSQLNHHHVCVVHDFIETEESDYLVLELVQGRNLRAAMRTHLSEHQKLDIAQQLLEVLAAVHAAGVVHRDLKPENIMVRPDGKITVLDFGLARSVDEDATMFAGVPTLDLDNLQAADASKKRPADTGLLPSVLVKTNKGTVIGTAGYMSPEQAVAEPATAASDVYSVGLILQELFTGAMPFEQGLSPAQMVVKAAGGETLPVSGLPVDLTKLIERLKSPAPGARPSAVDALEHLQRIIDKPKRRRKRAVILAVWIALAALAVGMTIQWVRASTEAQRANREAVAAREVSDFLVNLFEEANPEQARGTSLTAEEILNRGAERISGELEEQPLTRARLLMTIGRIYEVMGLYSETIPLYEEALEIREQELGVDDPRVSDVLERLGMVSYELGDHDQAESYLMRSLDLREQVLGPDHVDVARSLHKLGILYRDMARVDEAETALRRAQTIYEAEGAPDPGCLGNLAIVAAQRGNIEEAVPLFRQALALEKDENGADHPSTCGARGNLAIALKMMGEYDEAEALYLQNIGIMDRVLGEHHPKTAKVVGNLANLYSVMERHDEAIALYVRALEMKKAALGNEHPEVAVAMNNLGGLYIELGRVEEGEAMCLESLALREQQVGPDHPSIAVNLINIANAQRLRGDGREAVATYRRALEIRRNAFDPGHPKRVAIAEKLAEYLRELGREDEALEIEAQEASSIGKPVVSRVEGGER